jgi:hypothetical protein
MLALVLFLVFLVAVDVLALTRGVDSRHLDGRPNW